MPAKGYTVTVTQDLKDVTSDVLDGISETTPAADRNRAIQTKLRDMETAGTNEAEGISVRVFAYERRAFTTTSLPTRTF